MYKKNFKLTFLFVFSFIVLFIFSLKVNVYAQTQPLNGWNSDYMRFALCSQPCTIKNVIQINPQTAGIALQLNGNPNGSYAYYSNVGPVISFPYSGLTRLNSITVVVPNISKYIPQGYSIKSNEIDLGVYAGSCGNNISATNFVSSVGFNPQPPSFSSTGCSNTNPLNDYFYNYSKGYYYYNLPLSYSNSGGAGIFSWSGNVTINIPYTNFNFTLSGSFVRIHKSSTHPTITATLNCSGISWNTSNFASGDKITGSINGTPNFTVPQQTSSSGTYKGFVSFAEKYNENYTGTLILHYGSSSVSTTTSPFNFSNCVSHPKPSCSGGDLSLCSPPPTPSCISYSHQLTVKGSLVAYGGVYSYRDLPQECDLYYPAVSVTFNPHFLSVYHELFIKNLGNVIQYWIEPGI